MRIHWKRLLFCLLYLVGFSSLAGCHSPYDPESHWTEGELGTLRQGLTVGEADGCSTSIVNPLSEQLIEEINCLRPGTLNRFEGPNIQIGPAVFPFLQSEGPRELGRAIAQDGRTIQINSALRTLAQQFLLHKWWQEGRCGIRLAAEPGRSRHESGLAIDVSDAASWIDSLEANNFVWFGSGDPVHFDYEGEGTTVLSGLSVRAFQRLWNRNHLDDLIAEDGLYGPQTRARMVLSPAEGFAISGCAVIPTDVGVVVDDDVGLDMGITDVSTEDFVDVEVIDDVSVPFRAIDFDINIPDATATFNDMEPSDWIDASPTSEEVFAEGGCQHWTGPPALIQFAFMILLIWLRRNHLYRDTNNN